MKFIFWNVNGKDLSDAICALAAANEADVVVLAECRRPRDIEADLTRRVRNYYLVTTAESKVQVLTSFADHLSHVLEDGVHHTAVDMQAPLLGRLLVVAVHLPSKLHQGPASQTLESTVLAASIRALETRVGHGRTVVIGDLNMDPFEPGMVGAAGLHAVAAKDVASRGSRVVGKHAYEFFYNPTWAHLSDRHDGPPGTYFHQASEQVGYFWHALDQVLLRPSLLGSFSPKGLAVLDRAGATSLMHHGRPSVSDHLPLLLTLSPSGGTNALG